MPRPTGGALTGAGFTQVGSTPVYTKTATASTAKVDISGNPNGGHVEVTTSTYTLPVPAADWTTHKTTLGPLGVALPAVEDLQGLNSYSASL